jgi:neutral amino acid transport system permease protein
VSLQGVLIEGIRAAIGVPAVAYALAAIGLNVQFGFTGLLNFGQVGFLLMGAYGTAITASRGLPLPLAVLCGIAAAVGLGFVLGIPTLRLRADFLAIVTISMAEILRHLTRSQALEGLTGGNSGIGGGFANWFLDTVNPIPSGRYGVGDLVFDDRQLWITLVGWLSVVLCVLLVRRLVTAPWGRVVKGIRSDQDAPRSLGKNVVVYKVQALVLGGAIGALGGIILAIDANYTNPNYWISDFTFFAFAGLIIGGLATSIGPVIGAMLFWFLVQTLDALLRQLITTGALSSVLEPTDVGPVRFALVGLALMLLMIFRPQGILGDRDDIRAIDQ